MPIVGDRIARKLAGLEWWHWGRLSGGEARRDDQGPILQSL